MDLALKRTDKMSHSINQLWAARSGNDILAVFDSEPDLNRRGDYYTHSKQAGFDYGLIVNEHLLPMSFIGPGEKKKVTISVTAE